MMTSRLHFFILWFFAKASSVTSTASDHRNLKKGIAAKNVQSCAALEPHQTPSWWYSWSMEDGFGSTSSYSKNKGSFCPLSKSVNAVSDARDAGMDFVPMLWGSIPDLPLDDHVHHNLKNAQYLLTFNEPEFKNQANLSPVKAAKMWPQIVNLATDYQLEIVAPCSESGGHGMAWYKEWTKECKALYGNDCEYDYICMHMYYHPYPCDNGVKNWACIGDENASTANHTLQTWHETYGHKKIWITEFACAPWGGADCTEEKHADLMRQMGRLMESSEHVFRYAWYELYNIDWKSNSLNDLVWEGSKGVGCRNRKWLGAWGNKHWQIQTMDQCVTKAQMNEKCHLPLSLSIDDDACYCAIDDCSLTRPTWPAMTTYRHNGKTSSSARLTSVGMEYDILGIHLEIDSKWAYRIDHNMKYFCAAVFGVGIFYWISMRTKNSYVPI